MYTHSLTHRCVFSKWLTTIQPVLADEDVRAVALAVVDVVDAAAAVAVVAAVALVRVVVVAAATTTSTRGCRRRASAAW